MKTTKVLTIGFDTKEGCIDSRALTKLLDKTFTILSELDRAIAGGDKTVRRWNIHTLSMQSPGVITASGELHQQSLFPTDPVAVFIDGLKAVQEAPVRPEHFSDKALQNAKDVVSLLNDGVTMLTFRSGDNEVKPTQTLAANVDALILPSDYEDVSTIEGELQEVSLHGGRRFTIYDDLTGNAIQCHFLEDDLSKVKDALPHRVAV